MRYNYNVERECFIREDGVGRKLYLNIAEAQRVMTLHELGYSSSEIRNKIAFVSGKVSESTITTVITNVENGNINLDGDYPVPQGIYDELTDNSRITDLEERVKALEDKFNEFDNNESIEDKVRKWLKM